MQGFRSRVSLARGRTPILSFVMDEHWNGEFSIGEHRHNVRQMGADCLHILEILAVVDGHFDGPAV
jgi:hypothetical protein